MKLTIGCYSEETARGIRWWSVVLVLVGSTLISRAGQAGEREREEPCEVTSDFTFGGRLIHPGCLWEMQTWGADALPRVASVDVAGCQSSNKYYRPATVKDGWVRWDDGEQLGHGPIGRAYFEYKHIGMIENDNHVLLTRHCVEGSDVRWTLVCARPLKRAISDYGERRERVSLVCLALCELGHRLEGEVAVAGNEVKVAGKTLIGALGERSVREPSEGDLGPHSGDTSAEVSSDFRFDGRLIHPGCLWEMQGWLSDRLPRVISVDILGCQESSLYRREPSVSDGWVRWDDERGVGSGPIQHGYFEYKHIGELANGIHVVQIRDCGGGTGVFCSLMFLRQERNEFAHAGGRRRRTVLVCIGESGLGDRFDGEITIHGNSVHVSGKRNAGLPTEQPLVEDLDLSGY